ncbi:MAG: zinc-ribbon domain-containing protein [Acidimicrobiales bacterium]|nr:zinc-ribbon domain-containing protein [Acidimicrobiales bacterium]
MSTSGSDATVQVCTSCGSAIQPTDQFCRSCGAPLGAAGSARAADAGASGSNDDDLTITMGAPGSLPGLDAETTSPAGEPVILEKAGDGDASPWWRRSVVLLAACGAAALILVLVVAAAVLSSEGGGSTQEGPDLASGRSVAVSLDGDPSDTMTHEVRLNRGSSATVFVTGDPSFEPTLSVVDPDGEAVDAQLIRLQNNGTAATFSPSKSGKYSVEVSNFLDDQEVYDVELRKSRFATPEELAVGDCVSRVGNEEWARVSGFMIRPCDRAHDGQVFEQIPGFTDNDSEAQNQCDVARNQRIRLPGYVHWRAYYGEDLTCIVVRGNGSGTLERSIVTP